MSDEFYVGYRPQAPAGLARFGRRALGLVGLLVVTVAALLASAQERFDPGDFEFGVLSEHEGTLWEGPVPLLAVQEAGEALPRLVPLVLPGKHGAAASVAGLDGRRVRLRGSRIERGSWLMVEMRPESVEVIGRGDAPPVAEPHGRMAARGEIVDGKCFLGVMKPGRGTPHHDCAVRCLSGGVPPLFWVPGVEADWTFLLVPPGGGTFGEDLLRWVGRPVTLEGEVRRLGDGWTLAAGLPGGSR